MTPRLSVKTQARFRCGRSTCRVVHADRVVGLDGTKHDVHIVRYDTRFRCQVLAVRNDGVERSPQQLGRVLEGFSRWYNRTV